MSLKAKRFFLFIAFLCQLTIGCDPSSVYEKNIDIPDYMWDAKNKLIFEANIEDTASLYNLYVNVRHTSHYPYANIYIFITTIFPNGKSRQDTMECVFADSEGRWTGDGIGDIWDNQIPWLRNIKFPVAGKYTFEYEHAMRQQQVPFVMDVGLRIEQAIKE